MTNGKVDTISGTTTVFPWAEALKLAVADGAGDAAVVSDCDVPCAGCLTGTVEERTEEGEAGPLPTLWSEWES